MEKMTSKCPSMNCWKLRYSSRPERYTEVDHAQDEHLCRRFAPDGLDLIGGVLEPRIQRIVEPPKREEMAFEPENAFCYVSVAGAPVDESAGRLLPDFEFGHRRQTGNHRFVDHKAALSRAVASRRHNGLSEMIGEPFEDEAVGVSEFNARDIGESVANNVPGNRRAEISFDIEQHVQPPLRHVIAHHCAQRAQDSPGSQTRH